MRTLIGTLVVTLIMLVIMSTVLVPTTLILEVIRK